MVYIIVMQRTITIKLGNCPSISSTVQQFNLCCNFFLELGFDNRTCSKRQLQSLGYYEARERWPSLQSSLVQGARDCAADMLKRERCARLPVKRPTSAVRYNQRTFKAYLDSGILSLTTVDGRLKIPIRIPDYFKRYSHGKVAALRVFQRKGVLFANLVVELPDVPTKEVESPKVLGVDRGIDRTAVLSNNIFFNSSAIKNVRGRYAYLRQRLQAAGTRSAKRHLRRLAGRERRFQADVNHCLAKKIAYMDFDVVVLEDLCVRMEKRLGRKFNSKLGGWAFGQLEEFLTYLLEELGKILLKVPAEYTSQRCSRCGNLGHRKKHSFKCPVCGLSLDADLNAARNIAQLGMALLGRPIVNGPIVACGEAGPAGPVEHIYKPPNLLGGS